MPDDDDDNPNDTRRSLKDRTIKELMAEGGPVPIDPATQAELEKWFGLPSVTQLADEGKQAAPDGGSEMLDIVERRKRASAAVDPALLDALRIRTDDRPSPISKPKYPIELVIDESIAKFDHGMVDRAMTIAEPRTVEIPDALIDDLKDCTPQALLRDLHRPELFFDKLFELVDVAAEQRLDIVAEVRAAMRASWRLPPFEDSPLQQSRVELAKLRDHTSQPWTSFLPLLHNRSVTE
jgi:hypothetical protein